VGTPAEVSDPSTPFASMPEERPSMPVTPAAAGAGAGAGAGESVAAESELGGPLLSVSHVVKNFTVTAGAVLQRKVGSVSAVADVSFAVPRGATFGLVGESGCGKTTIGRLIVGLEKPNAGSISLGGDELSAMSPRERRRHARSVQLMFQDSYASMDPRMRVGTILREPLVIQHDGSRASQADRVAAILSEVGLPAAATERYPHEFSGGQRQRLGLARALMLRPSLIVADEPVSALDVSIQAQILNLMKDLQREHGLTYVFISHDLSVVRYMADTIGVMYLGKLVEVGPAPSVYFSPVHPYTAAGHRAACHFPLRQPEPGVAGAVTSGTPALVHACLVLRLEVRELPGSVESGGFWPVDAEVGEPAGVRAGLYPAAGRDGVA
jgi:peptide/nickel transport system ATP-binding protein